MSELTPLKVSACPAKAASVRVRGLHLHSFQWPLGFGTLAFSSAVDQLKLPLLRAPIVCVKQDLSGLKRPKAASC